MMSMTSKTPSMFRGKASSESTVASADPEDVVLVVRGTGIHRKDAISAAKSANGDPADPETPAPGEAGVISQVGGSQQGKTRTKVPEYTTRVDIAENFAHGAIIGVAIKRKYLTKGSGTEGGWAVNGSAPIEEMVWQPYGNPNAPRLPDAD